MISRLEVVLRAYEHCVKNRETDIDQIFRYMKSIYCERAIYRGELLLPLPVLFREFSEEAAQIVALALTRQQTKFFAFADTMHKVNIVEAIVCMYEACESLKYHHLQNISTCESCSQPRLRNDTCISIQSKLIDYAAQLQPGMPFQVHESFAEEIIDVCFQRETYFGLRHSFKFFWQPRSAMDRLLGWRKRKCQ